jgi:DNA-binding IclR family transcriptional regulator
MPRALPASPAHGAGSPSVKSADRVLDILELLARQGVPLMHHEIGTALGIPKSSLTHLLRNLVAREFIAADASGAAYALGPAVFRLVQQGPDRKTSVTLARPLVAWLARQTGEATSFSGLRDEMVERLCVAESASALSYRMAVGDRFPLYSTSAGKAILATMPGHAVSRYFKALKLEAHTASTLGSPTELRKELESVRRSGIAYSRGEQTVGVIGMAMAVTLGDDRLHAALNVVIPAARFTPELERNFIRLLLDARDRFDPSKLVSSQ